MFCTVTRWQLWRELDDKRPPGGLAARHLAACDRCQRAQAQARMLDRKLRTSAHRAASPKPATLSGPARQRPERAGYGRRSLALAGGLVASLALVLFIYVTGPRPASTSSESLTSQRTAPHSDSYLAGAKRIENRAANLWREVARSDVLDRSLNREIDREIANLRRDAEGGLQYVLRVGGLPVP